MKHSQTYYKAGTIDTAWYWCKEGHIHQWDRIESPHIYGQLIFNKNDKIFKWGMNSIFNKHAGTTRHPHDKEWSWSPISHHPQKLTQKWIKDLHEKLNLEENRGNLPILRLDNGLLPMTHHKPKQQKKKNRLKGFHQLLLCFKEHHHEKEKCMDSKKIFAKHLCDRSLYSEYVKNLCNSMVRRQTAHFPMRKKFN
jgi:hypothetical protein